MQEVNQRPACHRAEDLVTYMYGEASEAEALDFNGHLQQCDACRSEFALFHQVHDSIAMWRNEALGATFDPRAVAVDSAVKSHQFVHHERNLSALAAIREFFTVSPIWLRGATAFAALLLFVLGVATVVRFSQKPVEVVKSNGAERMHSDQELQAAINQAVEKTKAELNNQTAQTTVHPRAEQGQTTTRITPSKHQQPRSARIRGLNRLEREQLAADLRLTVPTEEEEMQLTLPDQQERPN